MFPFTITYKRHFSQINPKDKPKVITHLSKYVEKNKGIDISTSESQLSFRISLFVWSWDKFGQIEKGIFTLTDTTISFTFYMYRLFLIVSAMSGGVAIGTQKIWFGVFCFVVLGLGNWLSALFQFNHMTRAIAEGINELTKAKASANNSLAQYGLLKKP